MDDFEFFEDGDESPSGEMFRLPSPELETTTEIIDCDINDPIAQQSSGRKPRQPRKRVDKEVRKMQREERMKNKKVIIPSKAIWQVLFDDASDIDEDRKLGQATLDDNLVTIALPKTLSKALMRHQRSAIQVLWNSLFVRPDAVETEIPNTIIPSSGGILAHQIGTGKTFTSIALVALFHLVHRQHYFSSFTSSEDTPVLSHSVIIVPAGLQRTWMNEWTQWLGYTGLIDALDGEESRGTAERSRKEAGLYKYKESHQYDRWKRCGGCLLISYDTFLNAVRRDGVRDNVTGISVNRSHKLLTLPQLALFDEGHGRLYEGTTTRSVFNHIRTRGRIVISGVLLNIIILLLLYNTSPCYNTTQELLFKITCTTCIRWSTLSDPVTSREINLMKWLQR